MQNRHGFCTFPFVEHLSGLVLVSKLPILKDYNKKSKIFIERESIGYTTVFAGKIIPPEDIEIEGIKKLMNSEGLQCKEDLKGVAYQELMVRCLMVHLGRGDSQTTPIKFPLG